jgi:hypothetical protein
MPPPPTPFPQAAVTHAQVAVHKIIATLPVLVSEDTNGNDLQKWAN